MNLPTFCRVTASLHPTSDSDIRIEIWMPASNWNGKLQSVGNGAWAGAIGYAALGAAITPEREKQAARAHDQKGMRMADPFRVHPEHAAAGLWTTATDLATFAIEVQNSLRAQSNRVLSQATTMEMVTPVGVGPYAVDFQVEKMGEGWYFMHGGSNMSFQCDLIARRVKGYGAVIMTNGDAGFPIIQQLRQRIQREYKWDVLDQPVPRGYGPN